MKTLRVSLCLLFISILTTGVLPQAMGAPGAPTGKGTVVIKAARLIDGTGKAPLRNAAVIVKDDRILAVGSALDIAIPEGATVVDLGDSTLLPGFLDAHTHIVGRVLGDPEGTTAYFRDPNGFSEILSVFTGHMLAYTMPRP